MQPRSTLKLHWTVTRYKGSFFLVRWRLQISNLIINSNYAERNAEWTRKTKQASRTNNNRFLQNNSSTIQRCSKKQLKLCINFWKTGFKLNNFARNRLNSTGSVKRPTPNDWGPNQIINDAPRREPPKLGTKASNPSFAGVEKQTGRRHVYIGRLTKEYTIEGIVSWCSSNGAEISHIRELTKPESTLRSFHLVFEKKYAGVVENDDFWPDGVMHGRYYLNKNAFDWLKGLSQSEDTSRDWLKCGLFNTQSLRNKAEKFSPLIIMDEFDMFLITESWTSSDKDENYLVRQCYTSSIEYRQFNYPRTCGKGGRLVLIYKSDLNFSCSKHLWSPSLEAVLFEVCVLFVYRPPNSQINAFRNFLYPEISQTSTIQINSVVWPQPSK